MTKEEVLLQCIIEGNVVKLPNIQLDRKLYLDVNNSLQLIGGKWKSGKIKGFVFPSDPTELLSQIANGDKRNLKKESQSYFTPPELADKLIKMAEIDLDNLAYYTTHYPWISILEPSAGQGALIKALHKAHGPCRVYAVELTDINRTFLRTINDIALSKQNDFLQIDPNRSMKYDLIIANPPFKKNQDIDHISHMYKFLKPNGKMVSIASLSSFNGSQKKQNDFQSWLLQVNAEIEDIDPGAFKESGTMVGAKIITITKKGEQ